MNIIFTTIALALQLVSTPAFRQDYHLWEVQCLRTAGVTVSALYVFELIYRLKMRIPLIIHHFLTIIAISFTVAVFEYTMSTTYLNSACIWLFQATLEQPTFLGLLGYRLGWNPKQVARLLKFAAVQTFLFKASLLFFIITHIHVNMATVGKWISPRRSWYFLSPLALCSRRCGVLGLHTLLGAASPTRIVRLSIFPYPGAASKEFYFASCDSGLSKREMVSKHSVMPT